METGNPLAELSGAKRARSILGAKHSTIVISSLGLTALHQKNEPIQPTPLFQYSTIPSFQRSGYWQSRRSLTWPRGPDFLWLNQWSPLTTNMIRRSGYQRHSDSMAMDHSEAERLDGGSNLWFVPENGFRLDKRI